MTAGAQQVFPFTHRKYVLQIHGKGLLIHIRDAFSEIVGRTILRKAFIQPKSGGFPVAIQIRKTVKGK